MVYSNLSDQPYTLKIEGGEEKVSVAWSYTPTIRDGYEGAITAISEYGWICQAFVKYEAAGDLLVSNGLWKRSDEDGDFMIGWSSNGEDSGLKRYYSKQGTVGSEDYYENGAEKEFEALSVELQEAVENQKQFLD